MALSARTLALLSKPFEGGNGPSHGTIELIFAGAGAEACLPTEGNKLQRVLGGLKALQAETGDPLNRAAEKQLRQVVSELAVLLMQEAQVDGEKLDAALAKDGLAVYESEAPKDEPADRLATFLGSLFVDRPTLSVARRHYEQATRAFERGDWEAANSQFRSACDATFDALAHAKDAQPARREAWQGSGWKNRDFSRRTRGTSPRHSWRSPVAQGRTRESLTRLMRSCAATCLLR